MKMRAINTMIAKGAKDKEKVAPLPNQVRESKFIGLTPLYTKDRLINCFKTAELILDSIESIDNNKGFSIGKGQKKINCGHTIQRVPMGGYARIGGGQSILYDKPPVEREPKMIFKFDRTRQLAFKVGNNVGKDWVVVVAANGCIYFDTGSYASFHMPLYVVEQTRDYYKANIGNRILLLGTGHHLVLYTNEAPILFVRKHTITHKQSIPPSAQMSVPSPTPHTLKSKSQESGISAIESSKNKSIDSSKVGSKEASKEGSKEGPKEALKPSLKSESLQVVRPKPSIEVNAEKKPTLKSESLQVVRPKPSVELIAAKPTATTVPPTTSSPQRAVEPAEGGSKWNTYLTYSVLLILVLLCVYLLFGLFFGSKGESQQKVCKICGKHFTKH